MILLPSTNDTYTGQVEQGKDVIIDGVKIGTMVHFYAGATADPANTEWRAILTVAMADWGFGNGIFSDRNSALNYFRVIAAITGSNHYVPVKRTAGDTFIHRSRIKN